MPALIYSIQTSLNGKFGLYFGTRVKALRFQSNFPAYFPNYDVTVEQHVLILWKVEFVIVSKLYILKRGTITKIKQTVILSTAWKKGDILNHKKVYKNLKRIIIAAVHLPPRINTLNLRKYIVGNGFVRDCTKVWTSLSSQSFWRNHEAERIDSDSFYRWPASSQTPCKWLNQHS